MHQPDMANKGKQCTGIKLFHPLCIQEWNSRKVIHVPTRVMGTVTVTMLCTSQSWLRQVISGKAKHTDDMRYAKCLIDKLRLELEKEQSKEYQEQSMFDQE